MAEPDKEPAAPVLPEPTGLEARLKAVGLDPAFDPDEVKEQLDFARSNKGKNLVDATEFERAVDRRVKEIHALPETREHLKNYYGFVDQADKADPDDDAPVTRAELRRVETATRSLATTVGQLHQDNSASKNRETSRQQAERLLDGLTTAVRAVPGADEHPRLAKLFESALASGELPHNLTASQIREFVKRETRIFDDASERRVQRRTKPARDVDPAVALERATAKSPAKKTLADHYSNLSEALGLTKG